MPATRSRTSTEAPEVAVEDKKTEDIESQPPEKEESKETTTEEKTESAENTTDSTTDSTSDEKPVDKEEENEENGSSTTDALKADTNGDQSEDKVENGSAKRKSSGEEGGDGPDSTEITPKKVKVDAEESNGESADIGAGEEAEDKQTPVETSA